ncbi:MAG: alpha-galactosidase [Pirellulales bacterium]|nr:alpha-galactosidase [Pirellulales bacterium]
MKNIIPYAIVFTLGMHFSQFADAVAPTPDELASSSKWAAARFEGGKEPKDFEPCFSFLYGGKPSAELLKTWKITQTSRKLDDKRTERARAYADPATGLEVRCTAIEYADFPAVEWILHLANNGDRDTPILAQIRPLDMRIEGRGKDGVVVHHNLGDSNSGQSFAPVEDAFVPDKPRSLVLAPNGGRSSDGHLPYFNLDWRTGGIAAAIGWSGQWEAAFEMTSSGEFRVRAGQQLTHLKLHPGETIRTPRMLFVFWKGEKAIRGNNLFRQATLAHYSPRRDGAPVMPPICGTVGWAGPDGNYEKPHVAAMKPLAQRGFEVFWSDMNPQQWYPKGFPEGTGTWEPDPAKYPRGLKPVGDAAKAAGLGFLLWFEPERVHPGTKIDLERPEFVMQADGEWSRLFRLHDEAARKWLTDLIDVQIAAAGLAWVRWDFNIEPLGFWRRNDEPDRQGITEIRHVEGLYAMWDELRARHPGLVIDNCASGGRRIDLETCSRGLPLWHSDMQCLGPKPPADQLQNGGLFRWIPLHGCGNFGLEPSYVFRSGMTAGNILVAGSLNGPESSSDRKAADAVRKTIELYKKLRPFMIGDFYPLFPHDESESQWYGYQFDNPNLQAGCALLFRREKSPDALKTIPLQGLDPLASYEVANLDEGTSTKISGKDLLDKSSVVEIKTQPGAAVIVYRKIGREAVLENFPASPPVYSPGVK